MKLKNRLPTCFLAALALLASCAFSHIMFVTHGVHFKVPSIDFGDPPPRYGTRWFDNSMSSGDTWRPGTEFFENGDYPYDENYGPDKAEATRKAFLNRATAHEQRSQYHLALYAWKLALKRGFVDKSVVSERLQLLRVLMRHPLSKGGNAVLAGIPVENTPKPLPDVASVAEVIKPFVVYQNALAPSLNAHQCGQSLLNLGIAYPQSPIAESALIMSARNLLGWSNEETTPSDIDIAQRALHRLMQRYPRTRFRNDLLGWRGRIAYLKGRYRQALAYYRQQLAGTPPGKASLHPIDSIGLCEARLGRPAGVVAADLIRLERFPGSESENRLVRDVAGLGGSAAATFGHLIRSDRDLLVAYLDYRLDFTTATPELMRLEHCKALRQSPYAVRSHLFARLSEAALQLHKYTEAKRLAGRDLRITQNTDDKAIGLFVTGIAYKRVGRFQLARKKLQRLLRECNGSYLVGGARENLALLEERRGRVGAALDLYRKLKYDEDVAYMIDVRMSPSQLRDYIKSHSRDPERDLLHLSLGFRYMRDHKWSSAISAFRKVPKQVRIKMVNDRNVVDRESGDLPLQDPLTSVQELRKLDARIAISRTREQKAHAMLDLSGYYYAHRDLLLYNGALWKGERQYSIEFSWNPTVASRADDQALDSHHWKHECIAQSLLICREIIRRFPNTKVASRAAYRGACSADHLAGFSQYWRWKDAKINLSGEAVRLMRLAEKSPNAWIAARARKYQHVFAEGISERTQDEDKEKPTERYVGASQDWADPGSG